MMANWKKGIARLFVRDPANSEPVVATAVVEHPSTPCLGAFPVIELAPPSEEKASVPEAQAEAESPLSLATDPLSKRPGWQRTERGWAFARPVEGVSANYRLIDRAAALRSGRQAWHFRDVAERQHGAYADLLAELRNGAPRRDFAVAVEALRRTALVDFALIEIGCGSGYYSHVFNHLLPNVVRYTGVDISANMIAVARAHFPDAGFEVADACRLPFPDAVFDVAMNGVSLMHIIDYAGAIHETRRVAKRYCLFHTTIVTEDHDTFFLEKDAYGRPTIEVIVNEREFLQICGQEGLELVERWDSIPYDLFDQTGIKTYARTYLFKVSVPAQAVYQPMETRKSVAIERNRLLMLNLGCGAHHHPAWINLDIANSDPEVIIHDLLKPLPFVVETFDVVYHSHVLEHLPKAAAPGFLRECHRVLTPGGIIRVAIPDLEQIARLYVEAVANAAAGDPEARLNYDWLVIELLDQMVRQRSGGEMLEYWRQDPMPAGDFVMRRVGQEAARAIEQIQAGAVPPAPNTAPSAEEIGQFRVSGEIHQWMYDRFSLASLLREAGFVNPVVVAANESAMADFSSFELDTMPDGSTRKPDSLFMEAERP